MSVNRPHGNELEVRALSFRLGERFILSDIQLAIAKGRLVGIIGPNGSGKTTLLKCMQQWLAPTAGTVLLNGRNLAELTRKEIARRIGVVPQQWEAGFPFPVREVVMMGRYPHWRPFQSATVADRLLVEEALDAASVTQLAERSLSELSGGELQRVIIAQALAQSPELLLLDEPTSHLDIRHQIEIIALIRRLTRQGLTAVTVMHDLNLAAQYCDCLILMAGGRIVMAGDVVEVMTPEHLEPVFGVKVRLRNDEASGPQLSFYPLEP